MKRKNKRHKLVAVQFLSSITLDGTARTEFTVYSPTQHRESRVEPDAHCSADTLVSSNGCYASNVIQKPSIQLTHTAWKTNQEHEERKQANHKVCVGSLQPVTERPKALITSELLDRRHAVGAAASSYAQTVSFQPHEPSSATTAQCLGHSPISKLGYAIHAESGLRSTVSPNSISSRRRFAICSAGFRQNVVAVYSVLAYSRKGSSLGTRPGPRLSCRNISESELYNGSHPRPSSRRLHSPTGSIDSPDRGQILTSHAEATPTLSSLAPSGDETLSFARFLQPQTHTWLSNASAAPYTALVRVYGPAGLEPELLASLGPESIVFVSAGSDQASLASGVSTMSNTFSYVQSRRTLPINNPHGTSAPYLPRARQRNPSSTSVTGGASATSGSSIALCYPDPLFYYSPVLLDDPDLLVATGKRLFQLPNYLVSVLAYVRPTEQKRNVNREFHERFPVVQLTLTKLRSIKFVLVQIVLRLAFDLWIAAHAHVLFEKLILKLFVNKSNRRLCASASLLISAKLNDIKGAELNSLMQELEGNFRISRRDLLRTELEVSLGLEFCLIPTESECAPHYFRIHKLLDLTPPYPISCHVGSVNSLRTDAL